MSHTKNPINNRLKIISDLDGVIAYSQLSILNNFNKRFKTNLTISDWTKFDFLTAKAVNLSGKSYSSCANWLYSSKIMSRSKIIPETKKALNYLTSLGFPLEVVTSRPAGQTEMTKSWLKEKLKEIKLHIREDKNPISGNEFKLQTIAKSKASIYIEDDPILLEMLNNLIIKRRLPHLKLVFLVDRPWNKRYSTPKAVRRIGSFERQDYGWSSVIKALRKGSY